MVPTPYARSLGGTVFFFFFRFGLGVFFSVFFRFGLGVVVFFVFVWGVVLF